MYHDTMADLAYGDSRMGFEIHRDKIMDKALAAHDAGDEARAQELLAEANSLVYTGLHWQEDNGLMEGF
jgi:hypothetical protein